MESNAYEQTECCICGATNIETIFNGNHSGVIAVICKNDGLVFLNPRLTREASRRYYELNYDRDYRNDVIRESSEDEAANLADLVWSRVSPYVFNGKVPSVLDIGAGAGFTLKCLQQKRPEMQLAAIEPSLLCQENLRRLNIDVLASDVEEQWAVGRSGLFDLVVMRHVLEHFHEPIEVLRKVRDVLSDAGVVYIAVPDMMHPRLPLDGYWFRPVHLYYLSQKTLIAMTKQAGLETVATGFGSSEVWGVFKRGVASVAGSLQSNSHEQKSVLARFRFYDLVLRWSGIGLIYRGLMPFWVRKLRKWLRG